MESVWANAADTVSRSVNPALLPFRAASNIERDNSTSFTCELIASKPTGTTCTSVLLSAAICFKRFFRSSSPASSIWAVIFTFAMFSSKVIPALPARVAAVIPVTSGFLKRLAPGIASKASDVHLRNLPPPAAVSSRSNSSVSRAISRLYSLMAGRLLAGIHSFSACKASIRAFSEPMVFPVSWNTSSADRTFSCTPERADLVFSEVAVIPASFALIWSRSEKIYSILFAINHPCF